MANKKSDMLAGIKAGLRKDFIELINNYGEDGELYTFEYCSNNGCELADSTIDKIELCGDNLVFYYNENTNDYDTFNAFDVADLAEFYDDLVNAIEEEASGYDTFGNVGEINSAEHDLKC